MEKTRKSAEFGFGDEFLDIASQTLAMKLKKKKLDFINEKFLVVQDAVNRIEIQTTGWMYIFVHYTSDKVFVYKIYKNLLKLKKKLKMRKIFKQTCLLRKIKYGK